MISRLVRHGRRDTVVRREALAQGSIFILMFLKLSWWEKGFLEENIGPCLCPGVAGGGLGAAVSEGGRRGGGEGEAGQCWPPLHNVYRVRNEG